MLPDTALSESSNTALDAPHTRSAWHCICRWGWRLLVLAVLLLLVAAGAAFYVYETRLKPKADDEWVYMLHMKSLAIPISVPRAILLASKPTVAPWLDGLQKTTLSGQFSLAWEAGTQSLIVVCRPCTSNFRSLSTAPITVDRIQLSIHQETKQENHKNIGGKEDGQAVATMLSGQIILGEKHPVTLEWMGKLDANAASLRMSLLGNNMDIAAIYHVITPPFKELKTAYITGTVDVDAKINIPSFMLTLSSIKTNNFKVSGLGTEALLNSVSSCGAASNLPMNSWLVRSVISAEDQRFERHPGYDLEELMAAHAVNRQQGGIVRGASTLSQQTAKLMYTGGDKTLTRKMRELLYAIEMEQTLGKTRIMQLYLDNAPWGIDREGRIICGAQSAAQYFFNVNAQDLKPAQAVWLAAMLHSPVRETRRWQETGKINLERAIWVADYVRDARNSGPRARQKVINALKRDPSLGMGAQSR